MIIANAQVALATQYDYREEHQINESLSFWLTDKQANNTPSNAQTTDNSASNARWREQVNISDQGLSLLALNRKRINLHLNQTLDARARINLLILKRMYEAITGRTLNLIDPTELPNATQDASLSVDPTPPAPVATPNQTNAPNQRSDGFGLVYQRQEHYEEQESLQFQAQGVIHTQDGRDIQFSSQLTMSRSYVEDNNLSLRLGDAKKVDPLVINFDGQGTQLTQTQFNFDINNDGTPDQLASLAPGSGFLALDKNGDGVINNGSELFGPSTGQGFAELAKYDEDGNHFIDEGDSIYSKLRIFTTNPDGSQQLAALGDKHIGAIFLGHLTSPFQLKGDNNQSLGEVTSSGFYLNEDGSTGTVQEINLNV